MNMISVFSAGLAVIYSAFNIKTLRDIWILPISFLVFFLLLVVVYWLMLWIISLSISLKRDYERPSRFYYQILNSGYRFLCSGARVRIHTTGLEKMPKERFLLVANHLSRFDPMIQSVVLEQFPMAFITKPSNYKIPIGRRYMKRCCYLPIDRENPRNALKTIQQAAEMIASDKASIAVYPEGHRGDGLALQDFKPGCLKIAAISQCPIVVTSIQGTENIHKNFPWRKTDAYFDILNVIQPGSRKTVQLSEEIRGIIQEHIERCSL